MDVTTLRARIAAAHPTAIPAIVSAIWAAMAEDRITEDEATTLDRVARERQGPPGWEPVTAQPLAPPRRLTGSRPRTPESLARRRRWTNSGRLPPSLTETLTPSEIAVLAVVANEVVQRGDCRLCYERIAAIAGVCKTSVKNALRQAEAQGLVTREERKQTAWRNLSTIVRIVSPNWIAWNRLARRSGPPIGGKFVPPTNTKVIKEAGKKARNGQKIVFDGPERLRRQGSSPES